MKPGKKPMPTALKVITGNERYINKNEPNPKPLLNPNPPEWLPENAKEKYKDLALKLLGLGILKETDELSFNLMLMHWAFAIEAVLNLKEEGTTIIDNRRVVRKNPNLQAFRDNSLAYLRYASLFGLDPSSRSNISVPVDPGKEDPLEKMFRDEI